MKDSGLKLAKNNNLQSVASLVPRSLIHFCKRKLSKNFLIQTAFLVNHVGVIRRVGKAEVFTKYSKLNCRSLNKNFLP